MATSAHTTAPGGAKPPFPPFNKEYFASQAVWFAIAFVALYLIIAKLAIPQIGGIMAARGKCIADDLAEARSSAMHPWRRGAQRVRRRHREEERRG